MPREARRKKVAEPHLLPNEKVLLRAKGAFQEVLTCTDQRVLIIKAGLMAGAFGGVSTFQLPYRTIATAQVKFGLMTGYFELSAAGMQNTRVSYWGFGAIPARRAPNCISLNRRWQARTFRHACDFIMERVVHGGGAGPISVDQPAQAGAAEIERLWRLHKDGALNAAEFEAMKAAATGRSG